MRIVQTNKAYAPLIGGVETTVTVLSEGLSRMDDVSVNALVCNSTRSFKTETRTINGVQVTYLPRWGSVASLPISPSFLTHLAGLRGDILHVHEPFPLVDLSLGVYPRIRRHFKRIVVTWHSDVVLHKWALTFYRPFINRFLSMTDRILVSSPALLEHSDFLPPYRDRCEVVPLGLNLGWTKDRGKRVARVKEIRQAHGTPLVLFVGRLVYYKGLQYLIDAMAAIPKAKLVVIGSGPLQASLERRVQSQSLSDRVTFLPHMDSEELYSYYEACDVFVLPSTARSEAYGLVQIEAMACGKPVVSTEIQTGTTFVNQNGKTGLTVPAQDARALAHAVGTLLEDEDLRARLGQQAAERALREFTTERMVNRVYDIYRHLLGSDTDERTLR
jgi:glycosyltransferase involved in cell wall biosynthesis